MKLISIMSKIPKLKQLKMTRTQLHFSLNKKSQNIPIIWIDFFIHHNFFSFLFLFFHEVCFFSLLAPIFLRIHLITQINSDLKKQTYTHTHKNKVFTLLNIFHEQVEQLICIFYVLIFCDSSDFVALFMNYFWSKKCKREIISKNYI